MNMLAADKKRKAEALAERLRNLANGRAIKAAVQNGWEARDPFADSVAELAELIASLDFRQMS